MHNHDTDIDSLFVRSNRSNVPLEQNSSDSPADGAETLATPFDKLNAAAARLAQTFDSLPTNADARRSVKSAATAVQAGSRWQVCDSGRFRRGKEERCQSQRRLQHSRHAGSVQSAAFLRRFRTGKNAFASRYLYRMRSSKNSGDVLHRRAVYYRVHGRSAEQHVFFQQSEIPKAPFPHARQSRFPSGFITLV